MKGLSGTMKISALILIIISIIGFLYFSTDVFASQQNDNRIRVDISSCTELSTDGGEYVLTADILDSASTSCMNINAENIILDCQGYTIDGTNTGSTYGINITTSNATVKNCELSDWGYRGIKPWDNSTIYNNTLDDIYSATTGARAIGNIWNVNGDNTSIYNNTITCTNCAGRDAKGIVNYGENAYIYNNDVSGFVDGTYGTCIQTTGTATIYNNNISDCNIAIKTGNYFTLYNNTITTTSASQTGVEINVQGGSIWTYSTGTLTDETFYGPGISIYSHTLTGTPANLTIFDTYFNNTHFNASVGDVKIYEVYDSDVPSGANLIDYSYLNIINNSADTWAYINLTYNETEVTESGFTEADLELWKYNTEWTNMTDAGIDTTGNYMYYNMTTFSILGINAIDSISPTFNSNQTNKVSPLTYYPNNNIGFQINWTDETDFANATIELNHTGTKTNYTMSSDSDIYYYNLTDRPVEDISYKFFGNDTSGNENNTDELIFTISQNTSIYPQIFNASVINTTHTNSWVWANVTTDLEPNSDHTDTSWCGVSINSTINQTLTNSTGNWNLYANIPDGSHTLIYYCNNTNTNYTVNTNYTETYNFTIDTTPPQVEWFNQDTTDMEGFDIFNSYLNITYNITGDVDNSTIRIYSKTNTSTLDNIYYTNGIATSGYQPNVSYSILNLTAYDIWEFLFNDNHIYPATYNYDEDTMETTAKDEYDLDSSNEFINITLFNISDSDEFGTFEVFASNRSSIGDDSNPLRLYYCNETYSTGNPVTSSFCTNFYNIDGDASYNHTHGANSKHIVAPFSVNTTTNQIGDVVVTSTSSFMIRGTTPSRGWNVSYITDAGNYNHYSYTTDKGSTWTQTNQIIDAHVHQYDGTEVFYYYACANDTLGNENCTETNYKSDSLSIDAVNPTSPDVYKPINDTHSYDINVTYLASQSPQGNEITYYNITLVNKTYDVKYSVYNNSQNLTYTMDSSSYSDGQYYVRVEAVDNQSFNSFGYSEMITINNTLYLDSLTAVPSSVSLGTTQTVAIGTRAISGADNISDVIFQIFDGIYTNNYTATNSSTLLTETNWNYTFTPTREGLHTITYFFNDTDGDTNSTYTKTFDVLRSTAGGGSGAGGTSREFNLTLITEELNFKTLDEYQTYSFIVNGSSGTYVFNNSIGYTMDESEYITNKKQFDINISSAKILILTAKEVSPVVVKNFICVKNEMSTQVKCIDLVANYDALTSTTEIKDNRWILLGATLVFMIVLTMMILLSVKKHTND